MAEHTLAGAATTVAARASVDAQPFVLLGDSLSTVRAFSVAAFVDPVSVLLFSLSVLLVRTRLRFQVDGDQAIPRAKVHASPEHCSDAL